MQGSRCYGVKILMTEVRTVFRNKRSSESKRAMPGQAPLTEGQREAAARVQSHGLPRFSPYPQGSGGRCSR